MGLIHQIFNSQVNFQIMYSAGWLVALIDSNQSSNGLHNSQINPGIKSLVNNGLYDALKLMNNVQVYPNLVKPISFHRSFG